MRSPTRGTTHLDDEQVQRLLHGELTAAAAAPVDDHLAGCAECRAQVAEAEREEARVLDLLRHLDHRPPRVSAATLAVPRRTAPSWRRWAAGVVLAASLAGAAYAAPGSPLPGLVHRLVTRVGGSPQQPKGAAPPAAVDDAGQGIAVPPGERFVIAFAAEQPGGVAVVSLTGGPDVVVRAVGGAATFTSDVDRLAVANAGSAARFEIEVPRRAPRVEIRVAGRRVFAKDAATVRADGRRDAAGRYLLPLAGASAVP